MQKVVDIKFLKVTYYPNACSDRVNLGSALLQLEKEITGHIKNGWVIKGELTLTSHPYEHHPQCVIQTMVKYETTKVAELIEF